MGKSQRRRTETQTDDVSSRQKENRSRSAGSLGEAEGRKEGSLGRTPQLSFTRKYDKLVLPHLRFERDGAWGTRPKFKASCPVHLRKKPLMIQHFGRLTPRRFVGPSLLQVSFVFGNRRIHDQESRCDRTCDRKDHFRLIFTIGLAFQERQCYGQIFSIPELLAADADRPHSPNTITNSRLS
jgi:hypothetical protein